MCGGSRDWTKKVGVIEFVDVKEPAPQRVGLKYCVNTETWEIRFDNQLAQASSVDDSRYLEAKRHCARLTDPENSVRDKLLSEKYGKTFLRILPSSEDSTGEDFACVSYFELNDQNSQPAIWKLFPNAWLKPDNPFTPAARDIEEKLHQAKISRCQEQWTVLSREKQPLVQARFGIDPNLVIVPRGTDNNDLQLSCEINYSSEDGHDSASWSFLPNAEHIEMKPDNEVARAIDALQTPDTNAK